MKTENQMILKKEINQMNMNFVIKIVTMSSNITIMEQFRSVTERINQHLQRIDEMFSPFRYDSLVSNYQRGDQLPLTSSNEFKEVYNAAILSQQMTNSIYRPYFAGRFDPSKIVNSWAVEQVFNKELKPLLKSSKIVAIYVGSNDTAKFATKSGIDFRWKIDIPSPSDSSDILTTYYLQNGALATSKDGHSGRQVTIVRSSPVEAGVWSYVGASVGFDEFTPFVEHYNLTGIAVDKDTVNFNLGSMVDNKYLVV